MAERTSGRSKAGSPWLRFSRSHPGGAAGSFFSHIKSVLSTYCAYKLDIICVLCDYYLNIKLDEIRYYLHIIWVLFFYEGVWATGAFAWKGDEKNEM